MAANVSMVLNQKVEFEPKQRTQILIRSFVICEDQRKILGKDISCF